MQSLKGKKKWISDYEAAKSLVDDIEILLEFYKEEAVSEEELDTHHKKHAASSRRFRV